MKKYMFKTELNEVYTYKEPTQGIETHGIKVCDDEQNEYALYWERENNSENYFLVNNKNANIIFQCNYDGLDCLRKMADSIDNKKKQREK